MNGIYVGQKKERNPPDAMRKGGRVIACRESMSIGDVIILASIAVERMPMTVVNEIPFSWLCVWQKMAMKYK